MAEGRSGVPFLISPPPRRREEEGDEEEADLREHIASDITELIGWTPLIELKHVVRKDGLNCRVIGKMESYQPLSSVKDRSALRMIEDAEEKGLITPGTTTLVEPTSGNLGIALAYIAIRKGYKFIAVMPAQYSLDKQIILRYLGAEVFLTDPSFGFQGQVEKVEQLKKEILNVYVLDQFTNMANPEAHFRGTGPEIWKDTGGKVDIFVCGSGSGGGKPGRHKIQGLGPGFVPQNLEKSQIDEIIRVTSEEATTNARRLAREEGLLVGISSGANLAACLKVAAREENKGKMIVTMFPSGGERYASSELFALAREECSKMTF